MGNEKQFENKVKKYLKDNGCWYIKYWAGSEFTKSGVPDILAVCNGIFLGIELKAPNGKPSELQLYNIEEIKRSGGVAMVLYPNGFDKFKTIIQTLKKHQNSNYSLLWDTGVICERE